MAKLINYFKDQDIDYAEMPADDNSRFGSDIMRDSKEIQVGAGNTVFRANESGIWLGSAKWSTAPFRVDMLGNLTANSVTLSGYIAVGGAASDVNGNSTTISGGKITTGSITALQIQAGTITTNKLAFTPVDSTNVVASINASSEGIQITGARVSISGSTTFSSGYDPSTKLGDGDAASDVNANSTTITGSKIRTGQISSTNYSYASGVYASAGTELDLTTGRIRSKNFAIDSSGNAYFAGTLSASQLTAGTLSIGNTGQPSTITIYNSGSTGSSGGTSTAYLKWVDSGGGLLGKIWTDPNGYMGYNGLGGRHYFYTANTEYAIFQNGAQAVFNTGVAAKSLNVKSGYNARIEGGYLYMHASDNTQSIYGGNTNRIEYNAQDYHYLNIGGNLRNRTSFGNFTLYNSFLNLAQMTSTQASNIQGSYATNGSMYYNTTTNEVRININGTFRTLSWS